MDHPDTYSRRLTPLTYISQVCMAVLSMTWYASILKFGKVLKKDYLYTGVQEILLKSLFLLLPQPLAHDKVAEEFVATEEDSSFTEPSLQLSQSGVQRRVHQQEYLRERVSESV